MTVNEALTFLNIVEVGYFDIVSLIPAPDFEIHLRRTPNSCFINNYNPVMLKAWRANMDLQPVFNYYKAVSYMSVYFSRSESETLLALLQACNEVRSMNLHARVAVQKLASSYSSSKQVSLQESVYYSLPELWLIECFSRTVFVNTNIPPERIRICKSMEKVEELNSGSADIFKPNMVDRYIDRPNSQYKNCRSYLFCNICSTLLPWS